jgi:hypothetical protein
MAELKKQKDDKTGANSAFMSVDSPQTVTMTDLDTLGMTSVTFQQGVSVGGGGGSASTPDPPPDEYLAMCDAVAHPLDMPGVQPNGVWVGAFHDNAQDAFNDVAVHEDGFAKVMYRMGAALVGPIMPS